MDAPERVDVLCVTSAGGHLLQMHLLRDAWAGCSCAWVTHDADDARSLLNGDRRIIAYGPTTRSLVNLLRNLVLAWRVFSELRPRILITTGAGIAVPFAWIGRLRGAKIVYVESITRIDRPSLSCRLIAPIAHRIYVQWPELLARVRGARYVGNIAGTS